MIALDTNVLVRLITRDDPEQAEAAAEIMRSDTLWLPKTVILELVWVLSYTYQLDRPSITRALSRLMGLAGLRVEDAPAVAHAVRWYEHGMDFADALHLASSGKAAELVTFDRKLASRAERIEGLPPVRLLRGLQKAGEIQEGRGRRLRQAPRHPARSSQRVQGGASDHIPGVHPTCSDYLRTGVIAQGE